MFPESDLLPISALQHLLYCPRQCALIHVERLWAENSLTVQGKHLHERTDRGRGETRPGVRVARSLALRSYRLGLAGVSDVVEFHQRPADAGEAGGPDGASDRPSSKLPFPVEYKRGRPKAHDADRVQLCAQGLCLEEMLGVAIPAGALFYGKTRRRLEVIFDESLRRLTEQTAAALHELFFSGRTPSAIYEKRKCDRCSLKNLCLPEAVQTSHSAARYFTRTLAAALVPGHVPEAGAEIL